MRDLLPTLRRRNDWLTTPSWKAFDRFFEDFDLPVISRDEQWIPTVDVSETDDQVIVRAEIPGMDKKDIDITASDGLLTIKGEKKQEKEEEKEDYRFVERRYGSFSRSLRIPTGVEADKIDASYKDGVLTVKMPKGENARTRKIQISE